MTTNAQHLNWIYNRLIGLHLEDPDVDYMVRFRTIIREQDIQMTEYIKKPDLEVGTAYEVDARNFEVAIWDGEVFHGVRYKFGEHYMAEELHYDDDPKYGTCRPLRILE